MTQEDMTNLISEVKEAKTQSEVENLIERAAKTQGVEIDLSLESMERIVEKLGQSGNQELVQVLEAANARWCDLSAF